MDDFRVTRVIKGKGVYVTVSGNGAIIKYDRTTINLTQRVKTASEPQKSFYIDVTKTTDEGNKYEQLILIRPADIWIYGENNEIKVNETLGTIKELGNIPGCLREASFLIKNDIPIFTEVLDGVKQIATYNEDYISNEMGLN